MWFAGKVHVSTETLCLKNMGLSALSNRISYKHCFCLFTLFCFFSHEPAKLHLSVKSSKMNTLSSSILQQPVDFILQYLRHEVLKSLIFMVSFLENMYVIAFFFPYFSTKSYILNCIRMISTVQLWIVFLVWFNSNHCLLYVLIYIQKVVPELKNLKK